MLNALSYVTVPAESRGIEGDRVGPLAGRAPEGDELVEETAGVRGSVTLSGGAAEPIGSET